MGIQALGSGLRCVDCVSKKVASTRRDLPAVMIAKPRPFPVALKTLDINSAEGRYSDLSVAIENSGNQALTTLILVLRFEGAGMSQTVTTKWDSWLRDAPLLEQKLSLSLPLPYTIGGGAIERATLMGAYAEMADGAHCGESAAQFNAALQCERQKVLMSYATLWEAYKAGNGLENLGQQMDRAASELSYLKFVRQDEGLDGVARWLAAHQNSLPTLSSPSALP